MNQIKQKVAEIGLSQREISKRLGKNASYLAGVFRTGLSTAKQAELLKDLEVVGNGGYFQSEGDIIAGLDRSIAKLQDANSELRAESDRYFKDLQTAHQSYIEAQNAGIKALESYGIVQKQLNCANSLADVRGKFLDQCNKERWKYQDKYAYHFKLNLLLICMIVIGLILWVVV